MGGTPTKSLLPVHVSTVLASSTIMRFANNQNFLSKKATTSIVLANPWSEKGILHHFVFLPQGTPSWRQVIKNA